jgi:CheY-like chemotaxis protein
MRDKEQIAITDPGRLIQLLFVDDEPNVLDLLSSLFTAAYKKVRVYVAEANQAAIRLAVDHRPDLIISDIVRPGGNGYELLKLLRADQRTKYIPVFSVSGTTSPGYDKKNSTKAEAEELRQYRSGFTRVFPKPFNLKQLLDAVNWYIMADMNTDKALLNLGTETPTLDYKESVVLSTRDGRACLAKDVIAMANIGGGTIIIGVAEHSRGHFAKVGLDPDKLAELEASLVNKCLRPFIDPSFHIGVRRVIEDERTFIFLEVPGAKETPILARKDNKTASLYQGRLYIRSSAAESREITDSVELRQLLARFLKGS